MNDRINKEIDMTVNTKLNYFWNSMAKLEYYLLGNDLALPCDFIWIWMDSTWEPKIKAKGKHTEWDKWLFA